MKKLLNEIINYEYLSTNGLGGYSFGTLDQVNARKYHSLYTVSLNPPIQRLHMLSKIAVSYRPMGAPHAVEVTPEFHGLLSAADFETHLSDYRQAVLPEQFFSVQGLHIKRKHAFLYGTNMLGIRYELEAAQPGLLVMTPLVIFRDHHEVETPVPEDYETNYNFETQTLEIKKGVHRVYLKFEITSKTKNPSETKDIPNPESQSNAKASLYFRTSQVLSAPSYYPIETRRGYPDSEQHFIPGTIECSVPAGQTFIDIVIHTENQFRSVSDIFKSRKMRLDQLVAQTGFKDEQMNRLVRASDDFIVSRQSTGGHTILAGYPWFTDWGRDTMIALPGLTLTTKRYDEALEMIEGFLAYEKNGVIPNNFPEAGQAPMYNTSDATLWLFNAIYAYYIQTGDKAAVSRVYPQLMRILAAHIKGTVNEIYMDEDGLLSTGNERTQLTWMDVKVNDWVVTPRHGKAVEINALFYNALAIADDFAGLLNQRADIEGISLKTYMAQTKRAFNEKFWKSDGDDSRLYDLIIGEKPVDIPRPNMIFAISLPFPILGQEKWAVVVNYVERNFKINTGLLTLRRNDPDFQPLYSGSLLSRDGAYHRGTAWAWLLGPFLEAHYKTFGDAKAIKCAIERCLAHLDQGVYGSVSEIFEGAFPHNPRGCPAQAWSVAELIRVYGEIVVES